MKTGAYDDLASDLPPDEERTEAEESTQDELGVVSTPLQRGTARPAERDGGQRCNKVTPLPAVFAVLATQASLRPTPL